MSAEVEIAKSEIKIQRSGHFQPLVFKQLEGILATDGPRADSGGSLSPADSENINDGIGIQ